MRNVNRLLRHYRNVYNLVQNNHKNVLLYIQPWNMHGSLESNTTNQQSHCLSQGSPEIQNQRRWMCMGVWICAYE